MSLQVAHCCGIQLVAPSHTQPWHSEFSGSCKGPRWVLSGPSAVPADTGRSLGPLGQPVPQWLRHPGTHSLTPGDATQSPVSVLGAIACHLKGQLPPDTHETSCSPQTPDSGMSGLFQPPKEPGLWWGHWPLIKETSLPCQQSLPAASSKRELSPEVTYSFV